MTATTYTRRRAGLATAALLGAALTAGALAGCGGAQAPAATPGTFRPAAAATAQPANPVPVVRETGATVTPGEVYGSRDAYGDLYADGDFYTATCTAADDCGEQVTVYTLPAGTTPSESMAQTGLAPSDSQAVITGPGFIVTVTPVDVLTGGGSLTYFVSPAVIAVRVHGTVIEPAS